MSNKNKKIVIIGAGISGLSLAPLLAKEGFDVTVVDNNKQPGGVANRFQEDGFTFDTGPTWYLMPEIFDRYFSLFGKKSIDYYSLKRLDPSYRVFFQEDDYIDIRNDLEHTKRVFESLEKNGKSRIEEYLARSKYKYNIAIEEFLYKDYKSIKDFFNRRLVIEGIRLNIFHSLDSYAKKFFKELRARQILEFNTVFLGCSPNKTPALYSLMSHVDITEGVYYPKGGIYTLPRSLYSLGREYGVDYLFETSVKKIVVENKRIIGLKTDKDHIPCDILASACDYHHTETELLEPEHRSYTQKYWQKRTLAPTAFLIFLGLNNKIKNIAHHNLYLSSDWDRYFQEIFDCPVWPTKPCYYVGAPSKSDESFAPKGKESIFILVPVAPGLPDTETQREALSNDVIKHFEKLTGQKIQPNIKLKKIFSHKDYIQKYNLFRGTSMGLAHTLFQSAVFRPAHKSRKLCNLYYTGHYTHPGIGMPMVIISSQIVSEIISGEQR